MDYRKRLDEIICWLTKAENVVQKRSTTELEENLQELTVSDLFVSIFADAFLMHEHGTDISFRALKFFLSNDSHFARVVILSIFCYIYSKYYILSVLLQLVFL